MSVFRQLMMRRYHSAKNYMDLTVVGSPTISSGVVSGFSSSNYLQMANNLPSTDSFEIQVDFTTGNSFTSYETVFLLRSICDIEYNTGTSSFVTFNWTNSTYVRIISSPQTNTHYIVKFIKENSNLDIYLSTNGSDFTKVGTTDVGTKAQDNPMSFGTSIVNLSRAFAGSINIPNCYIKLNGVKYEFRFAFPLTVVGSPTITDGVVSGFSTSNYVTYQSFDNIGTRDFELATAFIINTTANTRIVATYGAGGSFTGLNISNTGQIRFAVYDGISQYVAIFYTYQTGTKYYVKGYRKGTEIGIKVSTDNVNWTTYTNTIPENASLVSSSNYLDFGVNRYGGAYLDGSIDLNYSYMILDGTKYIFTV